MRLLAGALAALLLVAPAAAATPQWMGAWAAPPTPPMAAAPDIAPTATPTPSFNNQTLVQTVRLTTAGKRLRLRLSNEYGAKALDIGGVRVAVVGVDGRPGPYRVVTFAGEGKARIAPHAPLLSDPVELPTAAMASLRVAIYLPEQTGLCTCHTLGAATILISPPGDHTGEDFAPVSTTTFRPYLTAVEVEGPKVPVIVAFGDSITDGHGSTTDANRRWPDVLAERLKGRAAVLNSGISGNRVLSDGRLIYQGESGLSRFDRDVLSIPGVTHMILLEGTNDIFAATPDEVITGYRQLIARAHAHGIKVYLATIIPIGAPGNHPVAASKARETINAWIRSGKAADGFIDLDAAIRDPADAATIKAEWQSGDWLHPSDAGYRVMGEAIDLKLFR